MIESLPLFHMPIPPLTEDDDNKKQHHQVAHSAEEFVQQPNIHDVGIHQEHHTINGHFEHTLLPSAEEILHSYRESEENAGVQTDLGNADILHVPESLTDLFPNLHQDAHDMSVATEQTNVFPDVPQDSLTIQMPLVDDHSHSVLPHHDMSGMQDQGQQALLHAESAYSATARHSIGINSSNMVYDNNTWIGCVENRAFYDTHHHYLGYVGTGGGVYDTHDHKVGRVDPAGHVYNGAGVEVYQSGGSVVHGAAYLLCVYLGSTHY